MCGIFGAVSDEPLSEERLCQLRSDATLIGHRGPDGDGEWLSASRKIFLCHKRLSIIDVSDGSSQPMHVEGHTLCFNGEIYNYLEIREELKQLGIEFVSSGDTEVLLRALMVWGKKALDKLDGMFAFAWVQPSEEIWLVTDCFGEKPLFVRQDKKGFRFASEIQALGPFPNGSSPLDEQRIREFLTLGFFLDGFTGFVDTRDLGPARLMAIRNTRIIEDNSYWQPSSPSGSRSIDEAALDDIEGLLTESLRIRMRSDVPLCLFLSSGVDSSLVAAIAKNSLKINLNAFTVAFPDGSDESEGASRIAQHLGISHQIIRSQRSVSFSIDEVLDLFGSPNDNTTTLSIYLMSSLARSQYKVALSGLGGDELFYGYNKYEFAYDHAKAFAFGEFLGEMTRNLPFIKRIFPDSLFLNYAWGDRSEQLAALKLNGRQGIMSQLFPRGKGRTDLQISGKKPLWSELRAFDVQHTLPSSYITAVDRGSMKAGLEVRTPFLCRRLMDSLVQFREEEFLSRGPKNVLKRILARHMPLSLLSSKKQGFITPAQRFFEGANPKALLEYWPLDADVLTEIWNKRNSAGYQTIAVRLLLLSRFFSRQGSTLVSFPEEAHFAREVMV